MASSKELAEAFQRLFSGLVRSSGRYVVPLDTVAGDDGKVQGRAWSSHAPITLALWEDHLSGKPATVTDEETKKPITGALGLGVVPINEESLCVFGAGDIDVYPLDLDALVKAVGKLKLPLIVCRTKSGGAHLYLFLTKPAKADTVRSRLMEWMVALNFPGVEVFPKQTLLSEKSDGSWINIPYSGGNRSVRYALKPNGKSMTPEEFVAAADAMAITPEALDAFELPPDDAADDSFRDGPPCLQTLARVGFGDWQNNGLFDVAVYLKKAHGDGWEQYIDAYNERYMSPPVGHEGVAAIVKSVKKKKYTYKCKDQPISAVCNRSVCLKREHGVGGAGDPGVVFGELKKIETDPVTWIWSVDAAEIECTTADLLDQRRFRGLVVEKLSKWPNLIEADEWAKLVRERLARADVQKVPEDGTREGQFMAHLAAYCTGRARARSLDEMLLKKAFTDPKVNRTYFRSIDFHEYMSARRFAMTERETWRFLRKRGVEHHAKMIKGKFVTYWSVPAFSEQTEEHDVPRSAPMVEM